MDPAVTGTQSGPDCQRQLRWLGSRARRWAEAGQGTGTGLAPHHDRHNRGHGQHSDFQTRGYSGHGPGLGIYKAANKAAKAADRLSRVRASPSSCSVHVTLHGGPGSEPWPPRGGIPRRLLPSVPWMYRSSYCTPPPAAARRRGATWMTTIIARLGQVRVTVPLGTGTQISWTQISWTQIS